MHAVFSPMKQFLCRFPGQGRYVRSGEAQQPKIRVASSAFLAAGIAVFLIEVPSSQPLALTASFLTGIGLGATVAPALFVAGFSLRALSLQRVFAMAATVSLAAFTISALVDPGLQWPLWRLCVIGVAGTTILDTPISAGINQHPEEIGRVGLLMLKSLINDGARGIPPIFRQIQVEGSWSDGDSAPPRR